MRRDIPLLIGTVLVLLAGACAEPEQPGSVTLETAAQGPGRVQLLARGEPLLALAARPDLDQVDAALEPASRRLLIVLRDGDLGGSTLLLGDAAGLRPLLRTGRDEMLSAPVWSDRDDGFALVRTHAPRLDPQTGRVLHRGELWLGSPEGSLRRAAVTVEDAARVVLWKGDTLLFTRQLPGDLPEERLARLDLRDGRVRMLAVEGGHQYGFTRLGERVGFVRTAAPAGSGIRADQRVEIVLVDPAGEVRVIGEERGALPTELRLDGDLLRYRLEGTMQLVLLDLLTGSRSIETLPPIPPPSLAKLASSLSMPYVHQRYDTPDDFDGSWACGPTSTVMAVQHFGRLKAWPVTISIPTPHQNDYGAYVARKYTAYGATFDRMQNDASGNAAWGAYGWCTEKGAGWAWRMQDYAKKHDLQSDFSGSTVFSDIKNAIDDGKVVVLSTQLTSAGHIITVKGYTSDDKLVVNDPWGDKTLGTYPNYKGADAVYGFSYVTAKWHITVYGTPTKVVPDYAAQLTSKSFPATLVAGKTGQATLTFKNTGTATWDASTRLGTTGPRDRESAFFSSSWLSKSRPAAAGAVKPGATATISFTLTAPAVAATRELKECFNLVQEDKAWFSDSGQGGPRDDALCLTIKVTPPAPAGEAEAEFGGLLCGGECLAATPPDVQQPDSAGMVGGCSVGPTRGAPPVMLLLLLLALRPLARRRRA